MTDKPNGGSIFSGLFGVEHSRKVTEAYERALAEQAKEDAARDSGPRKALRIRLRDDGSFEKKIVTLTDADAEQDRLAYAAWCESQWEN